MSIVVRNLVKHFGGRTVVDNVSFEIAKGELVSLLGPSGCGKTTTLRCIAGLETPESGYIAIDDAVVFDSSNGIAVEPYRRDIGMVFQSYAIWPHLTVFENVAFPLRIRRMPQQDVSRRVTHALEMVGLAQLGDRSAQQLSGGQQQRVAVARAIVHEPAVLLFDEPLSNLDAKLRDRTRAEIRRLQRELNVPAIYVTHDQAEALSLSDRILAMRDGHIHQQGAPIDIYAQPADVFVADALGAANFLAVTVSDGKARLFDNTALATTGTVPDGPAVAMVRPDRVSIGGDGANRLTGIVRQRLFMGGHWEYAVETTVGTIRATSVVTAKEGDTVELSFAAADCVLMQGEPPEDR